MQIYSVHPVATTIPGRAIAQDGKIPEEALALRLLPTREASHLAALALPGMGRSGEQLLHKYVAESYHFRQITKKNTY